MYWTARFEFLSDPFLRDVTVIRCAVSDILKVKSTFPPNPSSPEQKALKTFKTPGTAHPTTKYHILYEMNLHKCWTLVNHFDNCHPSVLLITIQYKFRFSLNLSPHTLRTHKV
jgi:hypothetical protein